MVITERLDTHDIVIKNTRKNINRIMDNFIDDNKIKEKLFFDGQMFDAAKTYIKIYKQAKKNIYIVDNYVNIDTLRLLKHKHKNVKISCFLINYNKPNENLFYRFKVIFILFEPLSHILYNSNI